MYQFLTPWKVLFCLLLAYPDLLAREKISPRDAAIIGSIQGATEFLPISSTAHTLLAEAILGIGNCKKLQINCIATGQKASPKHSHCTPATALSLLDIIAQLGTILSAIIFFRKEITCLISGFLKSPKNVVFLRKNPLCLLCLAFIPTGIVGFLLRNIMSEIYHPGVIAVMLFIGGWLILLAEYCRKKHKKNASGGVSFYSALKIGCWQCFALIPGVSRSMSTIVGGYFCGLSQENAVNFSFLLGLLTSSVATFYKLLNTWTSSAQCLDSLVIICGFLGSFLVSLIFIGPCIRFLIRRGLWIFAIYRLSLAVIIWSLL